MVSAMDDQRSTYELKSWQNIRVLQKKKAKQRIQHTSVAVGLIKKQ
jgi:hypothetical protein